MGSSPSKPTSQAPNQFRARLYLHGRLALIDGKCYMRPVGTPQMQLVTTAFALDCMHWYQQQMQVEIRKQREALLTMTSSSTTTMKKGDVDYQYRILDRSHDIRPRAWKRSPQLSRRSTRR